MKPLLFSALFSFLHLKSKLYISKSIIYVYLICGSFWWRDVFPLIDIYRGITICLPNAGDTVLLWKDVWNEHDTLQDTLPHLFSFTTEEDISVAQFMDNFHLPLSMQAREELDRLNNMANDLVLDPLVPDDWIIYWLGRCSHQD